MYSRPEEECSDVLIGRYEGLYVLQAWRENAAMF